MSGPTRRLQQQDGYFGLPGFWRRGETVRQTVVPLGGSAEVAVSAEHVFIGTNRAFEILRFDAAGEMDLRILVDLERPRITPSQERDVIERRLSLRRSEPTEEDRRFYESLPIPEYAPRHGPLVAGVGEEVWVALSTETPGLWEEWVVFGPDGGPKAQVTVPRGLTLLQVDTGHITGLRVGPMGGPIVEVYRLDRP